MTMQDPSDLETRVAALEALLAPRAAVPPITVGELTDVPTAGSNIASQWTQEVSNRIVHRFATPAARATGFPSPVKGTPSYLSAGDATEGPEFYNGAAWRRAWNQPWGMLAPIATQPTLAGTGGSASESPMIATSSFAAVANRRRRVSVFCTMYGTVVGDVFRFIIRRGTGTAGAALCVGPAWHVTTANYSFPLFMVGIETGSAAETQYTWNVTRLSGTGSWLIYGLDTYANGMMVEDLGPSAGPA